MEPLKFQHEYIRILAARELFKFGIKMKIKKLPSKNSKPKKRCYQVPLRNLEIVGVNLGGDTVPVPKVFNDLVTFIRRDLKEEGIFRREGSKVKEKKLVKSLDECYPIPPDTSIIEACAVLKVFLRNIPDNLIPREFMPWFLEANKLATNAADALRLCILLLPKENIFLLVFLLQLFNDITAQSSQNKMDAYNLAVVIAPNIFPPPPLTANLQAQSQMSNVTLNITKIMIERAKTYCTVPSVLLDRIEELHEEQENKRVKCVFCSL